MTNKDLITVLLCSYGFDRDIEIETYRGDYGEHGYHIDAKNYQGEHFYYSGCEPIMYFIYTIIKEMQERGINPISVYGRYSIKDVLNPKIREIVSLSHEDSDRVIKTLHKKHQEEINANK